MKLATCTLCAASRHGGTATLCRHHLNERNARIVAEWRHGISVKDLAERYGMLPDSIRSVLGKRGLKTRLNPASAEFARKAIRVAAHLGGASEEQFLKPWKHTELIHARQALCLVLWDRGIAQKQIGRWINRDHSTVGHNIRRAEAMLHIPEFKALVRSIENADAYPLPKQHVFRVPEEARAA